jgi:hypothetical protein
VPTIRLSAPLTFPVVVGSVDAIKPPPPDPPLDDTGVVAGPMGVVVGPMGFVVGPPLELTGLTCTVMAPAVGMLLTKPEKAR